MPSSGLWEQAKPRPIRLRRIGARRSVADMQRAEAWRAETDVHREGMSSPDLPRTGINLALVPTELRDLIMHRLPDPPSTP